MAFFDVAICLFYGIPVSEVSNTLIYLECLVPDLWTTPRSSHYQLITGVKIPSGCGKFPPCQPRYLLSKTNKTTETSRSFKQYFRIGF